MPCIARSWIRQPPKHLRKLPHPTISMILEPSSESLLQNKAIAVQNPYAIPLQRRGIGTTRLRRTHRTRFVSRADPSIATRTNVRDDASAPLRERGMAQTNHDFQKIGSGIFLPDGLDISRNRFRQTELICPSRLGKYPERQPTRSMAFSGITSVVLIIEFLVRRRSETQIDFYSFEGASSSCPASSGN